MRAGIAIAGIAGLIAVSAFISLVGPRADRNQSSSEQLAIEPQPTEQSAPTPQPTETIPASDGTAALQRVEPRAPLSPLAAPEDPATRPPRETLLHRPVAIAAGLIDAEGHHIALEGIEPLAVDETCERDGRSWPCGIHARTAFRNFLRGRAIACTVPGQAGEETVVSRCSVGRADPAEWLVSQGWAHAGPASGYEEAEEAARQAGQGIHGSPPGWTMMSKGRNRS